MKYYFLKSDPDMCYQLDYWKEYMTDQNLDELELLEAKMEFGTGYFHCAFFNDFFETRDFSCGKFCEEYQPRNGKNGRCRHSKNTYDITEIVRVLTKK